MQQQSQRFSFRKTFRKVFQTSEKDKQSIRKSWRASISSSLANLDFDFVLADAGDPISSESIGGGSDLAMGVIETSLAALQAGSAFMTNVPFISPVASLILQALKMRGVRLRHLFLYVSGTNIVK
jgi:hypothetical protein